MNSEENIYKYKVTLHTYFKRTYEEDEEYEEENEFTPCTEKDCNCFTDETFDIDKHLLYNDNYKKYAKSVFFEYDNEDSPFLTDFEYLGNGSFSFIFHYNPSIHYEPSQRTKLTPKKMIDRIRYDSFEDGMYESLPGSEAVVAYAEKMTDSMGVIHNEFGLIDCRSKGCIEIVEF
jgi:hypothetical protein